MDKESDLRLACLGIAMQITKDWGPDDPQHIIGWADVIREYVQTGAIPERPMLTATEAAEKAARSQ